MIFAAAGAIVVAKAAWVQVIHSDATVPSCEQDVQGTQPMGHAANDRLTQIWQSSFRPLRQNHQSNNFDAHPLCETCKEIY